MATIKRTGEPYKLTGRRMAFTSWYYVRPSGFGWFNNNGENVTVKGDEEPNDAHIKHFEKAAGVRLVAKTAERTGKILDAERPYEEGGPAIVTAFKENGIYRAWGCTGWGDLKGRGLPALCCYESKDGYDWKRPNCGLVEFNGNKNNNILLIFPSYASWGTVFIDPSAPASERYKWISEHHFSRAEYEKYCKEYPGEADSKSDRLDAGFCIAVKGAVSPDGLSWTLIDKPIAMIHSDTQIVAYYDIQLGKYVGYFRDWIVGPQAEPFAGNNDDECVSNWLRSARRAIGRAETNDFWHWPLSEVILEPNPAMSPNEVLYTNCKTTIPGAPDNHLMFPAVWNTAADKTHIALATSHDGKIWNYAPIKKVLDTAEAGQWDGGCLFASPNLIELPNGDFALPYTGFNVPHKYPRKKAARGTAYAVWSKGRLMGIEAKDDGCFTTVAVIPQGQKLYINAQIGGAGYVKVEAADLKGKPIPGREFTNAVRLLGDCHQKLVSWKEHDILGIKQGEPVILRFRMNSATIYFVDFI